LHQLTAGWRNITVITPETFDIAVTRQPLTGYKAKNLSTKKPLINAIGGFLFNLNFVTFILYI
jgi:hypothetical protein